jgi:sortase A
MNQVCPYLQPIKNGPAMRPCPSHQHRCFAAHQPRVIAPPAQAHFCLASQHRVCPYFAGHRAEGILPDVGPARSNWSARGVTLSLVAMVVVALAGLLPWAQADSHMPPSASGSVAPGSTLATTPVPVPSWLTPIQSEMPTVTARTVLPTPTAAPSNLAPPPADRPPDRIEIPSIGLDAPVVEVQSQVTKEEGQSITTWAVADGAVGYHSGTAYPGHAGNTVLSGHHNAKGEVFRYLVDVPIGAQIVVHVGQAVYPYVVSRKMILPEKLAAPAQRQENARWIEPFPDERLTLVTCWPYDDNTHRLIVIAQPFVPLDHPALPTAGQGQSSVPPTPE